MGSSLESTILIAGGLYLGFEAKEGIFDYENGLMQLLDTDEFEDLHVFFWGGMKRNS